MPRRTRREPDFEGVGRIAAAIARHPREFVGGVMATAAVFAIFINALFLQHGPHPAPIFATRPLLAPQRPVALPRPRAAESAPAAAERTPTQPAPRHAAAPARKDPIAELLAPSERVLAIQHALADYGYGQIKPTGIVDPATQAAIEKFERERHLPVTGRINDKVVQELAAMTGRPLQ